MSATATHTGPLAADEPPPTSALAGEPDEVAAWAAYVGLGGRYALTGAASATQWWQYTRGRWHPCDQSVVRAALRYSLEDAYHRLPDDGLAARRLDRLCNRHWVDNTLWNYLARIVRADRGRLGLR